MSATKSDMDVDALLGELKPSCDKCDKPATHWGRHKQCPVHLACEKCIHAVQAKLVNRNLTLFCKHCKEEYTASQITERVRDFRINPL